MTAVTSADTPMPRRLTLQEWDVEWAARDDAYELVDGIPTVAPAQTYGNREAAFLLAKALWPPLHHDYAVVTDAGVHVGIRDGQHTVRQPDVVVRCRSGGRTSHRAPAEEIALVAEVVSPSSIERDWITKRHEYATAGIPCYVVVDLENERLSLLTDPVDGDYRQVSGGRSVQVPVGDHSIGIGIAVTDLVAK